MEGVTGSSCGNDDRHGGGEGNGSGGLNPNALSFTPSSIHSAPGDPLIVPVPVPKENPPAKSDLQVSPTIPMEDESAFDGTSPDDSLVRNQEESAAGQKRPATESFIGSPAKCRRGVIGSSPQTPNLDSSSSNPLGEQPPLPPKETKRLERPDEGATHSNNIKLLANFFKVQCSPNATIFQYDIDIHPEKLPKDEVLRRSIFKKVVEEVGDKFVRGEITNSMSNGSQQGSYEVDVPDRNGVTGSYKFRIENRAELGKGASLLDIHVRSFQQSLKSTEQGLALCIDYSVPIREASSVIDFLKEKVQGFSESVECGKFKELCPQIKLDVEQKLKGLKVKVTHRHTSECFTVKGLTGQITRDIKIIKKDKSNKKDKPTMIGLIDYFETEHKRTIVYQHLPCLDLGTRNSLPMELCELAEVHKHLKAKSELDEYSRAKPNERRAKICELMRSGIQGGPFCKNLGLGVETDMTKVDGHIIDGPVLKFGNQEVVEVQRKAGGRRLKDWHVVHGMPIENWALVFFTSSAPEPQNEGELEYQNGLQEGFEELGMCLNGPSVTRNYHVQVLSDVSRVEDTLKEIVKYAVTKLDFVICVLEEKHEGYRYIKWVSEMKIGVITQCCLAASTKKDHFFRNLALKINAKLGGTNVELDKPLPGFKKEDSIMLIGASVNHPEATKEYNSSIAAVAANIDPTMAQYAARVEPQYRRKEKILNFGKMVKELVEAYNSKNMARPNNIIIFRQGVSESQIDMVLNEELPKLKKTLSADGTYNPSITLVMVVKRHRTRLFRDDENDGENEDRDVTKNVPKGTVVDKQIVQPKQWSFYLCSHSGLSGTSKPTYYRVLYDENKLTSKNIQELVYHICFTCARCTHSVSLVPPLYYARLAALRGQAFREVLPEMERQGVQSKYILESKLKDTMFFV